jgi:hypothetical protein
MKPLHPIATSKMPIHAKPGGNGRASYPRLTGQTTIVKEHITTSGKRHFNISLTQISKTSPGSIKTAY